jgi:hypothetical protein
MDVQESQSNWPNMQKTLGKPGFYQRRGQEPNFWVFSQCFVMVREVLFLSKVIENEEPLSTTASPRRV